MIIWKLNAGYKKTIPKAIIPFESIGHTSPLNWDIILTSWTVGPDQYGKNIHVLSPKFT